MNIMYHTTPPFFVLLPDPKSLETDSRGVVAPVGAQIV